jgi:hypothetical protein
MARVPGACNGIHIFRSASLQARLIRHADAVDLCLRDGSRFDPNEPGGSCSYELRARYPGIAPTLFRHVFS